MEYWKKRCDFMENLILGCGGVIADSCCEYVYNNPEPDESLCEKKSNSMTDLINAIEIRNKYNAMSFDEFIVKYEKHFNIKISEDSKDRWKFTGLNNVDFLTMKMGI